MTRICTCTELERMTVCHDMRSEPHLVGCPRWGMPKTYERGRQDERRVWEKALTDSSLPNLYVRLVRDLAMAPCDNCGGDIATCDCDES